jgi:arsenite methyltransferase
MSQKPGQRRSTALTAPGISIVSMGMEMKSVSLDLDTEDLAQLYERLSAERQYKAGQRLVEDLDLSEGESVLDLGCGTGLLAEYIAGIVGARGSVVGVDPLPFRIEIAKRKSRANLSFRVGNAYDLSDFAPDTFDAVCMNAVFHWFAEKTEPLRQTIRVLKKGGRVGISTGAKEGPNPLHSIKDRVLSRPPYNQYASALEPVVHRVTDRELKRLLREAGFEIKQIETRPNVRPELTAEAAIRFAEASSFGNFLGHLPANVRAQARDDILQELELPGVLAGISKARTRLVAVAVKPFS